MLGIPYREVLGSLEFVTQRLCSGYYPGDDHSCGGCIGGTVVKVVELPRLRVVGWGVTPAPPAVG
jgi:hypothetical protein